MKLAVMFSGQGAQHVDMGMDFIESEPSLREKVDKISSHLNLNVTELIKDSNKIGDTRYAQPLMVTVQMLIHDYLLEKFNLKPQGYTGFSLGFFSALYSAHYYTLKDTLSIVEHRGRWMAEVAKALPGKMSAVFNLEDETIEKVCQDVSKGKEVCVAANYNAPGQTVISGSQNAIDQASIVLKSLGARRIIPLHVSGAFHSPMMKGVGDQLEMLLKSMQLHKGNADIYKNTDGCILNQQDVTHEIVKQVYSPVYFKQSIENMIKDGYTHFIEIGPGTVLSGLVRKINQEVSVISISKVGDLQTLKEFLV